MPYLNMLINNYGLATEYYANQHHSLPNYLWLTSGGNDGVTIDSCFPVIWKDNVIQELTEAGVSWKAYEQGLPSDGYVGCTAGEYRKRHGIASHTTTSCLTMPLSCTTSCRLLNS